VRYFVTITGPDPWAGYVEAETADQARYAAHDAMIEFALGGRGLSAGTEITAVPMPVDERRPPSSAQQRLPRRPLLPQPTQDRRHTSSTSASAAPRRFCSASPKAARP
jgi:hypothetical protein